MLNQLFNFSKHLLFLVHETQQNKSDIKELRNELDELSDFVEDIAVDIQRMRENETHEREKLVLRLENELLKF